MKEKVVRVIVATFRVRVPELFQFQACISNTYTLQNLVIKAPSANLPAMLVSHLLPFTKNLATRKWTDEDILEDIKFLKEELTTRFESLT